MSIVMLSSHVLKAHLVLSILCILGFSSIEAEITYETHLCENTTAFTFTPNSTYQFNRDLLLSYLISNSTDDLRFYNTTVGLEDPTMEAIYGIFSCRGDLTSERCQKCVSTIAREGVQKYCPLTKISMIWYDLCMIRYSNTSFFGNMEKSPMYYLWTGGNNSEPDHFMQLSEETMNSLVAPAANAPSGEKKFATKQVSITGSQQLYNLVQCTPDLSSLGCDNCLQAAIAFLPECCNGKEGVTIISPSCKIQQDMYQFYSSDQTAKSPPPPGSVANSQGNDQIPYITIVAIVVPIVIVLLLVCCLFLRKKARKKYHIAIQEQNGGNDISYVESLQFDLATIETATNRFSIDNRLGGGGFGEVYKGTLPDGLEIAVKRLSSSSSQGINEFKNEVVLVAKLQHRNLVRLLGFCSEGEEKILVYELVQNKSLDYFLFDSGNQVKLDWSSRYKIIGGIARGMLYLHQDSRLKIIHRDLKASNILLDDKMNPKISDFGTARIFGFDQTQGSTGRIVGTLGYMPPEYVRNGHFSVKSDVYSLGVLILEIVTGEKNTSFYQSDRGEDLLTYAWKHWRDGAPQELLDSNLRGSYSRNELVRCIHIALLCVQEDPAERPTMQAIVLMLSSYSVTMSLPQKPAFCLHSRSKEMGMPLVSSGSSNQVARNSASWSINEASTSELYPR